MITRIVWMQFRPEAVNAFLALFHERAPRIRSFPGCHHLALWRDRAQPHVMCTYSLWESEAALEAYRHAELFRDTWAQTKPLFAARPRAWSFDTVWPTEASLDYPIYFGQAAPQLEQLLGQHAPSSVAVLVDTHTALYCYPHIRSVLPADHLLIRIPAGETHKQLDTCQYIWSQMLQAQLDRQALLINLGGGVIGDMGGFCAHCWKRGIRFVQVPTTLLAQVDASTGGKLGVDFMDVKNIIGAFGDPLAVVIDTTFLRTLPPAQLRSGFAEVVKHALIADAEHWQQLIQLPTLDAADWTQIVPHSLAIKRQIVAADPYERGLRKALNFGHTIGHAIESAALHTTESLLHGEAIAIGMICESWLSAKKAGLPDDELQAITHFLLRIFGCYPLNNLPIADLLALMANDKKNEGQGVNFSLLPHIGAVEINHTATPEEIQDSLAYYMETCRQQDTAKPH